MATLKFTYFSKVKERDLKKIEKLLLTGDMFISHDCQNIQ